MLQRCSNTSRSEADALQIIQYGGDNETLQQSLMCFRSSGVPEYEHLQIQNILLQCNVVACPVCLIFGNQCRVRFKKCIFHPHGLKVIRNRNSSIYCSKLHPETNE
jgi:hypothetical protein